MDSITSFQQWLGAPVVHVVADFWPFLLVAAFAVGAYFVFQNYREATVAIDGSDTDGDGDSDGAGGGDGGGGD